MSLQTGQAGLNKASKAFVVRWNEARTLWRDQVAQEFEDRYVTPLLRDIRSALEAMDHMAGVLTQVRHECE